MATMDGEDCIRTDVDTVTVLPCEDDIKQDPECSEVEDLQNSLRQAVHDETVRPKMQCLMMDPSFSMVTMMGEDSGIEWETSTSRCPTPWASEVGSTPLELYAAPSVRPATPGALPAGRIIIVMDEEKISRRKRTKDRAPSAASIRRQQQEALEEQDEVVGRPELVGFSLPNVKADQEQQKEVENTAGDHEQQVFCLVAEGSEILNIVVPPMLASVDEEESTAMEDNLSYLEESLIIKSSGTTNDYVFGLIDDEPILTEAVARLNADETRPGACNPYGSNVMDPPGAPVTRPQARGATSNVDYFENFTFIDAQAPGSPAVIKEGQENQQAEEQEEAKESQDNEEPNLTQSNRAVNVDEGEGDVDEEDMACALLDDVFYGGTDAVMIQGVSDIEECRSHRSPLKQSGSALFGSQEEILTPIFLPEGPAKIIDQILFEEPKAMAFLYTDLYEEAIGSRVQEEDTQSLASEKSFHSRHSDREARGYLEKYVLKDETPVMETTKRENVQEEPEGIRLLSQDSYDLGDLPANPDINNEDEITDFFRSSGNSSPCDINPFNETVQEEDEAQAKIRARLEVIRSTQQMFPSGKHREKDCHENRTEQTKSSESCEFVSEETDWSGMPEDELDSSRPDEPGIEFSDEMPHPVVPPRRKVATEHPKPPKTSLDLSPLRPVDGPDEGDEAGVKEQRLEDKETASPVETADEGDGEREESSTQQCALTADTSDKPGSVKDEGDSSDLVGSSEADKHTEISSSETAKVDLRLDQEGINVTESTGEDDTMCPPTLVPAPAKEKGQCIIL